MTTYSGACACADPDCRMYGCKLYRPAYPSYYTPVVAPMPATIGAEVFNTLQEIVDLKRRVAELEKRLEEKP